MRRAHRFRFGNEFVRLGRNGILLASIVVMMGAGAALSASANDVEPATATLKVTTTVDEMQANGQCSLREAIRAANTDATVDSCVVEGFPGGLDIIELGAGTYTLTLTGAEDGSAVNDAVGDLDIKAELTIQGAGANVTTIEGVPSSRTIHVAQAVGPSPVRISGVTIRSRLSSVTRGGVIYNDGSTLDLRQSIVNAGATNMPVGSPEQGGGGGIYNSGKLTLVNVTVAGNQATGSSGGSGGGIYNAAAAELVIGSSTISDNRAGYGGAPIRPGAGAGIFNAGKATIVNSTISGNDGDEPLAGGGIYNSGEVSAINLTIANNTARIAADQGREYGGGAGIYNADGNVELKNTILDNTPADNCRGIITSFGYNLETGARCALTQAGDLPNTDPRLGPLQNNGPWTFTHALSVGSPAIDAGLDCPPEDQRGERRPFDGDGDGEAICDIGAFESKPPRVDVYLPLVRR